MLQINKIALPSQFVIKDKKKLLIIRRWQTDKFLTGADEGAQTDQESGKEEARGGGAEGGLRRLRRHGRHDGILGVRGLQKELRSRLIGN